MTGHRVEQGIKVNSGALWTGLSTLLEGLTSQEDIGASVALHTSPGITDYDHFVSGEFISA